MGGVRKNCFLFLLGWVLVWDLPDLMDWRRGKVRKTRLWTAGKEKESCLAAGEEEAGGEFRVEEEQKIQALFLPRAGTTILQGWKTNLPELLSSLGNFLLGYMVFIYFDFKATLSLSRPRSSMTQNPRKQCVAKAAEERAAPKSHSAPLKKVGSRRSACVCSSTTCSPSSSYTTSHPPTSPPLNTTLALKWL